MKSLALGAMTLFLVAVAISGCNQNDSSSSPQATNTMTSAEWSSYEVAESASSVSASSASSSSVLADKFREAHDRETSLDVADLETEIGKAYYEVPKSDDLVSSIKTYLELKGKIPGINSDIDRAVHKLAHTPEFEYMEELWDKGIGRDILRPVLEKRYQEEVRQIIKAGFLPGKRYKKISRTQAEALNGCSPTVTDGQFDHEGLYRLALRLHPNAPDTSHWRLLTADLDVADFWSSDGCESDGVYNSKMENPDFDYQTYVDLGLPKDAHDLILQAVNEAYYTVKNYTVVSVDLEEIQANKFFKMLTRDEQKAFYLRHAKLAEQAKYYWKAADLYQAAGSKDMAAKMKILAAK